MHTVSMRYKVWGIMLPIILMLLCCLCGCEQVEDLGSLSEFSHPYAGEYVCDTRSRSAGKIVCTSSSI